MEAITSASEFPTFGAGMSDDRLTEALATQVLGWKTAPGRFLKSGRSWIPSWKFAPLKHLEDAFQLLDTVATAYTLTADDDVGFKVEALVGERIGRASGEPKARTITIALARALGLELPDEFSTSALTPVPGRSQRSRRRNDGA